MKKNLPILMVAILMLGLILACGGSSDDGTSGGGSSNSGALVGKWVSDNDNTVAIAFGDDGSYAIAKSDEVVAEGTYTFDGSALVTTPSDGSGASSAQVEINGDTMTTTDPDGSVATWTKQ